MPGRRASALSRPGSSSRWSLRWEGGGLQEGGAQGGVHDTRPQGA